MQVKNVIFIFHENMSFVFIRIDLDKRMNSIVRKSFHLFMLYLKHSLLIIHDNKNRGDRTER